MTQMDEQQTALQDQQLPNMEMPMAVRVRRVRDVVSHAGHPHSGAVSVDRGFAVYGAAL